MARIDDWDEAASGARHCEESEHDERDYLESHTIERKRQAAARRNLARQNEKVVLARIAAVLVAGQPELFDLPERQGYEKTGAFNLRVERRKDTVALRAVEMAAALIDSADFYLEQSFDRSDAEDSASDKVHTAVLQIIRPG